MASKDGENIQEKTQILDEGSEDIRGAEGMAGWGPPGAEKVFGEGKVMGMGVGMSPLLANVALLDSFHGTISSGDEPSTESRMCTEESAERMTSSTEGMVSLSEDSSGRDTYAQAHGIRPWNVEEEEEEGDEEEEEEAMGGVGDIGCSGGGASAASSRFQPPTRADTIELDESDEQMNGLLGSYREISIEEDDCIGEGHEKHGSGLGGADAGNDTEEEVSNLSPDSAPTSPLDDIFPVDSRTKLAEEIVLRDDAIDEPNRRPNSLHLMPSAVGGGGVRSKRCNVTASPRRNLHGVEIVREGNATPLSSTSAPLPSHALLQPRSSSASVSSSSDLEGMFGVLQGLVLRDGDMVSFVAEDLQEQIKRASPVVRRGETPSFPGSSSSTPSLYKQAVMPQLVPFDPTVLEDIERQTRNIASSVDTVLQNLTGTLHSMSSLAVDCMESYHDAVCKTCDSMDGNIKAMYQLMAKFEELGNMMRPVHRLLGQIKEIKRLLDLLEQVASSTGS